MPNLDSHGGGPLQQAWRDAESLCIKCGFCLPACPTYRETGAEASSPRGRLDLIYAAATGELGIEAVNKELWLCLGCLACESACPSGIKFGEMLTAGRTAALAAHPGGAGQMPRRLVLYWLSSPGWTRLLAGLLRGFQGLGLAGLLGVANRLHLLPAKPARLLGALPPLPKPLRWRRSLTAAQAGLSPRESSGLLAGALPRVLLLSGCVMDALFGAVHQATVEVLARNGISTVAPAGQGCCGALYLHAGEHERALTLAKRNIQAFEGSPDPIIVNSAGCGATLKEYGKLLRNDPAWRTRAAAFSSRVLDICEYLAEIPLDSPGSLHPLKVAYDDPCHLLHAQGISEQPRKLLGRIPGLELVALREASWCCGSAGSYSLTHPEMAQKVLARKMDNIAASGAEVIATGNPGCLLQLQAGARQRKMVLRVLHPVELLAQAYRNQ